MKYNHKLDQSAEILEIQTRTRKYISLAQYKRAFNYLTKFSKKYPSSYYIASMLATLNAEDAFLLPKKEKDKIFNEAANKLRNLLYATNGASPRLKSRNINEYYWFSQQHKKQYLLGKKEIASGDKSGLYPQGVGAGNYAYKLLLQRKKKLGLKWAKISQASWEEYFVKINKKYHDPWYWYALSLGLQGKTKEFEVAMDQSAKLSKRNSKTNPAFKKLRMMVIEALN